MAEGVVGAEHYASKDRELEEKLPSVQADLRELQPELREALQLQRLWGRAPSHKE